MALVPGTRLGPYQIENLLGAGGMGEVYKALDTRLGRIVALKVISPDALKDPRFLQRFDREGKLLSTLNHRHICTLHDVGEHDGARYVVMEYLDGVTLAEWLVTHRPKLHGAALLERVLEMAIQIAEALDHAHRRGIAHRDLKPGNVMVTPDGLKIVDFGLAKTVTPGASTDDFHTHEAVTRDGTVIGTMPYMAPEQLEGKDADTRSDVWAFGCVLHEMLSGRRAFDGATNTDLIAAIVAGAVAFPEGFDRVNVERLRHFQQRCLAKAPDDRWASGRDLALELRWIASTPADVARPEPPRIGRWLGLAAAAGVAIVATSLMASRGTTAPAAIPSRLSIVIPESTPFDIGGIPNVFAISRDGSMVAHAMWRDGSPHELHLRRLNAFESVPIKGSGGAVAPFFSPDGAWVGFLVGTEIRKAPVAGGPVLTVGSTADNPTQPSWSSDDRIIFADAKGAFAIPSAGGAARALIPIDPAREEVAFNAPSLLADGRTLLFAIRYTTGGWNAAKIVAQDLTTSVRKVLIDGGYAPRVVFDNYLLFSRDASLLGAAFNPATLEIRGAPIPVLDRSINNATFGWSLTSVSDTGVLAYNESTPRLPSRLVWVDRTGRVEPAVTDLRVFAHPRISPNGHRFAVDVRAPISDIWVGDTRARTIERFTFDPGEDESPVWHPDGRQIAFAANRDSGRVTLAKALDGADGERIIGTHGRWHHHLGAWSPDGGVLTMAITESTGTPWNLMFMRPGAPDASIPTATRPYSMQATSFSPDGRWIAYASNESGRSEIYVEASQRGQKRQVSLSGGSEPLWSRNGKELFYRNGDQMMIVDVPNGPALTLGRPRPLFEGHFEQIDWGERNYDVSPDGQRFLMVRSESARGPAEIRIVTDWVSELKAKFPR